MKWLRLGAEQGEDASQWLLGLSYANGEGVPQDCVQAYMWLNLAASKISLREIRDPAVRDRDRVAALMTPEQIAEAQKLAREWRPGSQ